MFLRFFSFVAWDLFYFMLGSGCEADTMLIESKPVSERKTRKSGREKWANNKWTGLENKIVKGKRTQSAIK